MFSFYTILYAIAFLYVSFVVGCWIRLDDFGVKRFKWFSIFMPITIISLSVLSSYKVLYGKRMNILKKGFIFLKFVCSDISSFPYLACVFSRVIVEYEEEEVSNPIKTFYIDLILDKKEDKLY